MTPRPSRSRHFCRNAHALRTLLIGALLCAAPISGCAPAIGDPCEGRSDCAQGLVCTDWPCLDDEAECQRSCELPCNPGDGCPEGRVCSGGWCALPPEG